MKALGVSELIAYEAGYERGYELGFTQAKSWLKENKKLKLQLEKLKRSNREH